MVLAIRTRTPGWAFANSANTFTSAAPGWRGGWFLRRKRAGCPLILPAITTRFKTTCAANDSGRRKIEGETMKTNLTQRRIKARKAFACGLCKPWKQGWADKKTVRDIRHAQRAQQQLAEISQ